MRYRRLAYVALAVTDLAASTAFYRDLVGLQMGETCDSITRLRCSELPQNLILAQGPVPGVARIAFELESRANLGEAFDYLAREGFAPAWVGDAETARLQIGEALRFREPVSGLAIEFHVDPVLPAEPFIPTCANIARLGHFVLNVADFDAVSASLVGKLNFRVSDEVPGKVAFLRCYPNPFHHSLAILSGPANGYNHINFMVSDIDDIGRGMNRMKAAGVPIVFGPGRHLPSGSIFLYFLDPDGMTAEYSFGMEEFGADDAREPRVLPMTAETLDTWGSVPDPRFAKTGAILTDV